MLNHSIITSFGNASLSSIFKQISAINSDAMYEIYLLRLSDQAALGKLDTRNCRASLSECLEDTLGVEQYIEENLQAVFGNEPDKPRISAFATYFPDITSQDKSVREQDLNDLSNAMEIACGLAQKKWSNAAIVEMVLGSRLTACYCSSCQKYARAKDVDYALHFVSEKFLLAETIKYLESLVSMTSSKLGERFDNVDWCYAIEIEPGKSFYLSDIQTINDLLLKIDKHPTLKKRIGVNLDIAHFEMVGFDANWAAENRHRLVNCHLSDHPGIHTRDFPLNHWQSPYFNRTRIGFLNEFFESPRAPKRLLPCSNSVSIELECGISTDAAIGALGNLRRQLMHLGLA